MTDEQIRALRRKYWRRRAMYRVPEPARLIRDLVDVYNTFCELDDPSRPGSKFLNANARGDFLKELAYVAKGLLSDKPGMKMYVKVGTVKATGFVLHRCRRSTSQLESYHLHLRQARRVGAIGSGPRLKHVTSNMYDMRWTYRAAVASDLLPDCGAVGVLPYNDQLYDIASSLGMPGVGALPELRGWVRTRKRPAVLQHGVISLGAARGCRRRRTRARRRRCGCASAPASTPRLRARSAAPRRCGACSRTWTPRATVSASQTACGARARAASSRATVRVAATLHARRAP